MRLSLSHPFASAQEKAARRRVREAAKDERRHQKEKARARRNRERSWHLLPWLALTIMAALWPTPAKGEDELNESNAARLQPGRGRQAASPAQIPARGWKDVLWRTWKEFNQDRITRLAGGVTFFGLLALFPGLATFVSLYGLFADVGTAQEQLAILAGVLPADALTFIGKQMLNIAKARDSSLGVTFLVGLLLSLWSANAGMKALFDALNIAYDETEKRSFVKLTVISLGFTVAAILFMLVATAALVVLPVAFSFIGFGDAALSLLRWPILLVCMVTGLAAVYRYGPSREHARWRWVSWGSVLASVLWLGASLLFSWYMSNFAHYDRTYGALGAVVGAMTWMWLTSIIVLLGAELNSELEHQTACDSTTGRPAPMGARGATMADTLGETADSERRKARRKA
jgi:membrane protein